MNSQWYEDKLFVNYFPRQLSQSLYYSYDQLMLQAHGIECLINFQDHFDYIEALFYNRKK